MRKSAAAHVRSVLVKRTPPYVRALARNLWKASRLFSSRATLQAASARPCVLFIMLAARISSHAVSTCCSRRAVTAASPKPSACVVPAISRRELRRLVWAAAAEEATATATAEASSAEAEPEAAANGSQAEPSVSPMDRAREALAAEEVDKTVLDGILSELDAEVARLGEAASAAESKASSLEASVSTARDQLLRLNADFDNFRRRSASEKEALADSVKADVVQQLLPLIDNFELARTQVKPETEGEIKINTSYQGLYKQMVDIMRALGIEAVSTVGSPFDPEMHEAIMREPNEEHPDGTVLMEFRKGFKLGDKLIRPAMVKVSVSEGGAPTGSSEE